MLDKAKCYGTNCSMKESCERFTKKDSETQPYLSVVPAYQVGEDIYCDQFVSNESKCETARKLLG